MLRVPFKSMLVAAAQLSVVTSLGFQAVVANASPVSSASVEPSFQEQKDFFFLPAPGKAAPSALFVFAPGANRNASEYLELMQLVQSKSALNLAVATLKFTVSFPNPIEFSGHVRNAIEFAKADAGISSLENAQVFVGGHSLGGIFARDLVVSQKLGGLVLFASYLNADSKNNASLANYPYPVLTLGGERDGLTRITRIAKEWEQLQKFAGTPASENMLVQKPVVVFPNMNHSLFASGEVQKSDFSSPLSVEVAHNAIADKVAAFLNVHGGSNKLSAAQLQNSRAELVQGVEQSGPVVGGFLRALQKDDVVCEESQVAVLNIAPDSLQTLKVKTSQETNVLSFAGSKPKLEKDDEGALAITVSVLENKFFNPLDFSTIQESPKEIACKMKSQEAVLAEVAGTVLGEEKSCAELNEQSLQWALSQVTETQRERYSAEGHALEMVADKAAKTGITWLPAGLQVEKSETNNGAYSVQSPTLRTALTAPKKFAGMAYCKLLPPSRAVEWILVESFR